MATQKGREGDSAFASLPGFRVVVGIVVASVLLGAYATWITADFLPRALTFIFVAVGVGGILYRRDEVREQLVYAGYVFSGFLFLTPVTMILPDAVSAGTYGVGVLELVFMTMNVVLVLVFAVPAAVVAYLSYRIS